MCPVLSIPLPLVPGSTGRQIHPHLRPFLDRLAPVLGCEPVSSRSLPPCCRACSFPCWDSMLGVGCLHGRHTALLQCPVLPKEWRENECPHCGQLWGRGSCKLSNWNHSSRWRPGLPPRATAPFSGHCPCCLQAAPVPGAGVGGLWFKRKRSVPDERRVLLPVPWLRSSYPLLSKPIWCPCTALGQHPSQHCSVKAETIKLSAQSSEHSAPNPISLSVHSDLHISLAARLYSRNISVCERADWGTGNASAIRMPRRLFRKGPVKMPREDSLHRAVPQVGLTFCGFPFLKSLVGVLRLLLPSCVFPGQAEVVPQNFISYSTRVVGGECAHGDA